MIQQSTYKIKKRSILQDRAFTILFWIFGIGLSLFICALLFAILSKGIAKIDMNFILGLPQELDEGGGIGPMLFNSFYILIISMLLSIPIGIGSGIYLAEYAPNTRFTSALRMCVESLASVPSIVFGLFGMALFMDYFKIGLTILGGGITLALLNLPMLVRVTEEAIRGVPIELKEAAYALGVTKFQCIRTIVLPTAFSRIITGISLVAGRAYGESAVIILTAGTSSSGVMWDFNIFSPGSTLAVHLWYVQSEAIVPDAREIADKAAAVLVLVVLAINFLLRGTAWLSNRKLK